MNRYIIVKFFEFLLCPAISKKLKPRHPTAELIYKIIGHNVIRFLDTYVLNRRFPRSIGPDQARSQIGKQVRAFCSRNNVDIIEAPVNDHRTIGLVERFKQTLNLRPVCFKVEKSTTNSLNERAFLKTLVYQLRVCDKDFALRSTLRKKKFRLAICVLSQIRLISHMRK